MAEANRKMTPPDSSNTGGSPAGATPNGAVPTGAPPRRGSPESNGPDGVNHTIVQCPACQTKFLVGTAALKDVEFPRFHCSRCDHLFSLDTHLIPGLNPTSIPGLNPTSIPAGAAAPHPSTDDFAPAYPATPSPTMGPEDLPDETTLHIDPPEGVDRTDAYAPIPDSAIDDFGILAPPPPPTTRREGSPSRALSIPRGLTGRGRADAPVESLPDDPRDEQIAFDFIASSVPSDRIFESEETRAVGRATQRAKASEFMHPALQWSTRGWRGAGVVLAPIGACLIVLALAALALNTQGAFSSTSMATMFPAAPRVAPPDLRLEGTTYGSVALSNGETVRIISGTLTNESTTDVRNVVLEGLTFDAAGDKLTSVKVTSGATLSHSRLQSLTPDIITELQSGGHAKPLHLKAGESEKVTLALTDQAAADARFFSARVFSVR